MSSPDPAPPSIRERKKLTTARDLARSAYELACAQGFDAMTIDDVAARAGYSRRTFANYYSCKQEAVVDGFLMRLGFKGDHAEDLAPVDGPTVPATFPDLIDSVEAFVVETLRGPAVQHIRTFARMVHEHPTIEPYVNAAFLSFKHSAPHRMLAEAYGETRVSMFFGAVIGSLSGVIELILGPLATSRTGRVDSYPPLEPLPAPDLDRALTMIETAFGYLREGFSRAFSTDRPSSTERD